MKAYVASFIVVLAVGAAGWAPHSRSIALKCPPDTPVLFPDAPETVYVLNGKLANRQAIERLHRDSIETVEVVCAVDLHRAFGIESRRGGVSVFTAPGPSAALRASMQRLVQLQNAYLKAHGRFATTVADLSWSDPAGLVTVKLQTSEDGARWSATGMHRYLLGPTSSVFVSSSTQPADLRESSR